MPVLLRDLNKELIKYIDFNMNHIIEIQKKEFLKKYASCNWMPIRKHSIRNFSKYI